MNSPQHIEVRIDGAIATITLNRPESLNAFTDLMETELIAAFERTDDDDDVRAVIITGAGRAFCAGMDLSDGDAAFNSWRARSDEPEGSRFGSSDPGSELRRDGGGRVVLRMFESRKPIIAAINGPAVGVGITMTLAADFRLAAEGARMGFVFARRGLVPESCSSWFLPRLVGMQTALDWVFSGRVFSSEEALEKGLLRSVHPADGLIDAARSLAAQFSVDVAPVSVALSRQMLWRMLGAPHPIIAHQIETHALNVRGISADAREGIAAFIEKRSAEFPEVVSRDTPDVFGTFPSPPYVQPVV